ncbi:MAG: choice-of-anchor Q domain-containing protein [Planctomycetota bacterium]
MLTGFTITGGTGTEDWNGCWGGGVYCDHASPVIRANVITGNSCPAGSATEGKGGGIGCLNSRAVIERNIIRQNQADRGGGVFVYYYTWGSVYYGDVTVINNLIYDNFANDGGGVDIGGGLLVNNTIADNNAAARGGNVAAYRGAEPDGSRLVVANNIIAGALAGGGLAWMTDPNTLCDCIAYNNVWGNAGGDYNGLPSLTGFNGNISHDPQFVDKAARDYHLQCSSPCIEAGTNDPCGGLPATDFDQNLRPIDADKDGVAAADIGAFESLGNRPSILLTPMRFEFSATADDPNPPASALFIRNGACGTLNWELSETCPWLQVEPVTGSSTGEFNSVTVTVDTSALVAGSYNCDLTVSAPGAINSPQTVPVHLSFSGTLRVPTADYPTIRAAIDAAIDGDIILVADGTYTGPGNRDLDFKGKAIVVRGENGPQNCIIDCQGTLAEPHRGLYFHTGEGANSVVEGFTITGGCASSGGVIQNYTSSPTVRNCILIANSAYLGGAVNNYYSSPTFENCLFAENTADWGGAIENMNSSPTITNSAFTKNTASYGGAIDNYGGSTPKVTGCILWGNDADNGPQIYGDASVSYSDVQAGCPGLFVDAASGDFHLSPGSPAIDAGHPLTDWSNEPWPNGGRVNMGAYGNTKEATRSSAGFEDLAQLCAYWLQYDPLLDIAPEPAGDGIINFLDFAIFADWWLTE